MRLNRGHIVGQIAEGKAAESTRVRGKHCGGKDAGLKTASREDGECNRQRALTDTGNVLDR